MKRTNFILSALFFLLFAGQIWAQEKLPYKSKAAFKADTLQYLEYNYNVARSIENYKDKTVGEILNELEYPVSYIVEFAMCDDELISLSLGIRQKGKKPSPLEDYYIEVVFSNPPKLSDFHAVYDNSNGVFTSKIYDFIKDLKVKRVMSNPYIITKRKNLEAKQMQDELNKKKQSTENKQNK